MVTLVAFIIDAIVKDMKCLSTRLGEFDIGKVLKSCRQRYYECVYYFTSFKPTLTILSEQDDWNYMQRTKKIRTFP